MKSLIAFITLFYVNYVSSYNILAIVSMPLGSHYRVFHPLFNELANKGHSVTVMNNFPDYDSVPNLKFVDLQTSLPITNSTPALEFFETLEWSHLFNVYKHVSSTEPLELDCQNLFESQNAKAHLAGNIKYDVIFVEQFMSDCGLAYAAVLYDAPIIGITSHVLLPWSYPRLGIPFDVSSDAFYFSNGGPNPSFYHKVEAFLIHNYFNTVQKWLTERTIKKVFNQYAANNCLDFGKIFKERVKMMFVNQHFSITGGRLLSPQILEIGGVHITEPKPVPKDIERFINESRDGVIYVSFGTYLKASTMSSKKLQQFVDAFKQIPQRVLWKWDNDTFPAVVPNVMTKKWMPQLDILCHPKVLAFVSHGGMLSLSESAYCGKPVVSIPFFGDQFSNAAAAVASGLGTRLFFNELNSKNLLATLKQLTSEKMQASSRRVSKLWHDRPQPVMDSAIYWTEYVARHRSTPPILPSMDTPWFQSTLLVY